MTGIFASDAGALGIKTAATLEIEPGPAQVSCLSFAFDDLDAMAAMFHEVTLRRLSSEMIAMDAGVALRNAGTPNLVEDAKAAKTVPLMTRAVPFPALPVTHPDGRRILPIHGVFPTSALGAFNRDYLALKADYADRMVAAEVTVAEFFAAIAGIGLLYESVFYWPDTRLAYHGRMTPDYLTSGLKDYHENLAGRELVNELVVVIITPMRRHGSGHFQIGRLYPCITQCEEASAALLRGIKRELDPDGIINPGPLGL